MLNPVKKLLEEKVAEAMAPAVTEVTTKAAEIFYPAIAQAAPSRHGGSRYYQVGVFDARDMYAPRVNLPSEHDEAEYLAGYNSEREKIRAETERAVIRERAFGLVGIALSFFCLGAGCYVSYRVLRS